MADGRVVIDVLLDDGTVAKGVANLDSQLSGLNKSGENASLGIGKIVTALGLVALGAQAIGMVKDSIRSAFDRIDTMEQFERVMTAITGSTDETKKALDRTRDSVVGTAYGLDVAAKGVQDFVTRGVSVDTATDRLAAWGDAVAFYGKGSNQQLSDVMDALAKMTTSGKVGMDQLNRLFDVGIDAVGMYATAVGRDATNVQKDLSAGKISAEDFIDTVTTAMMEGTNGVINISGAAKEAGATWGASFDNMKAAVTRGVVKIIQTIDEMLTSNGLPDMRTMVAEFGEMFENTLSNLAEAIPPLVEKIRKIYDFLEPWLPLLGAIALGVGSAVLAFAAFNSAVSTVAKIKQAFMALNKTMLASPWFWIIAAVVIAVALIYYYWEPISEFFKGLWDKVKAVSLVVWEVLKEAWKTTVDWFKDIWSNISSFFSTLWSNIKEIAISVWDSVKNVWNATVDWFKSIWDSITSFFSNLWEGIVRIATSVWDAFIRRIQEIVTSVTTMFSPLTDFFRTMWETVSENALNIWNSISDFFINTWENIKIIASNAWELIKNAILGPILLLLDLVTGDMEGFKSNLAAIWGNIKEAASNIWKALKDIVISYIETLIKVISNIWDTFKKYITGLWKAVWDTAKNIFEGLKNSIKQSMDQANTTISQIWEFIKTTFNNAMTAILNWVKDKFQQMKNSIQQKMNEAKTLIQSIWNGIKTFFTQTLVNIWNTIKQKFDDMKNAVKTKTTEAKNNLENIWKQAVTFLKNIDLLQIGKDIINGLIKGIGSMAGAVGKKVNEIATGIKDKIKGALSIFSPSRWMRDEIGVMFMRGFEVGLDKEKPRTLKKVDQAADWMKPDVKEFKNHLRGIRIPTSQFAQGITQSNNTKSKIENVNPSNVDNGGGDYVFHIEMPLDGKEFVRRTIRFTAQALQKLKVGPGRGVYG